MFNSLILLHQLCLRTIADHPRHLLNIILFLIQESLHFIDTFECVKLSSTSKPVWNLGNCKATSGTCTQSHTTPVPFLTQLGDLSETAAVL